MVACGFSFFYCIHCLSCSEPLRQVPQLLLRKAPPEQRIESELFSHFLNASTEGGTTPTLFNAHLMACRTTYLGSGALQIT